MPIPHVTVVHTPACHLCAETQDALAELGAELPLRVEFVEAASARGTALVDSHRPTMFPLVLLDGVYFSQGRLPRRKLRARLASWQPVGAR